MASTLASHGTQKTRVRFWSEAGRSPNHGVNGRGAYQCFESNTSAWRVGVAPPYAAVVWLHRKDRGRNAKEKGIAAPRPLAC